MTRMCPHLGTPSISITGDVLWFFGLRILQNEVCTPKTAGKEGFYLTHLSPLCGFSKNVSSKERVKPWFFVTFNIILRHIFPENFIEFPQVVQEL